MTEHGLYGIVAEFPGIDSLVAAARAARAREVGPVESYTPFPVEELEELIAGKQRALPAAMFVCGLVGLVGFFLLEYWCAAIDYPINVGGRPYDSWPAFIPSAFEVGLVWAAAAGFAGFFIASRLPKLFHPLNRVPGFERASQDAFFLAVEAGAPGFDRNQVYSLFQEHGALRVVEVPS
jgi:hypothetical protein